MKKCLAAIVSLACVSHALARCPDIGPAPRTPFSSSADFSSSGGFSLDAEGILVYDYGDRYNGLGKFRNPYFITNYANALYRDYLVSGCVDTTLRKNFLLQANYLVSSAERRNGAAVWTYPFESPKFMLKPGWISGIGQARIAGVLQRAFAITGEESYQVMAEEAMKVYELSLADGGVSTIEGNVTWIEEAPDPGGTSYKILNGHITALAGILDFYKVTGEKEWQDVFNQGVNAVRRDIAEFDAGFVSYYSLAAPPGVRRTAGRRGYNLLHVSQLLWLFKVMGDPFFLKWASRFQAYEMNTDRYTAKGSTDPKGHGPEQAAAFYGNHYWSHSDFPTWLEVDVGEPEVFKAVIVHGNSFKATPHDFSISAQLNGEWHTISRVRGNTDLRRKIKFKTDVLADAFRIDIKSDNGNDNVALQAFMPIRQDKQVAPITNNCNYHRTSSTSVSGYNYDRAFDGDASSSMQVYCAGWVILPARGASQIITSAHAAKDAVFEISFSDDLKNWESAMTVPVSEKLTATPISRSRFIKIAFDDNVSKIAVLRPE